MNIYITYFSAEKIEKFTENIFHSSHRQAVLPKPGWLDKSK